MNQWDVLQHSAGAAPEMLNLAPGATKENMASTSAWRAVTSGTRRLEREVVRGHGSEANALLLQFPAPLRQAVIARIRRINRRYLALQIVLLTVLLTELLGDPMLVAITATGPLMGLIFGGTTGLMVVWFLSWWPHLRSLWFLKNENWI